MGLEVVIDASNLLDGIQDVQTAIRFLNQAAVARIRDLIMDIVMDSFELAIDEAGSGFPLQYANHLRRGIRQNLSPVVYETSDGLIAEYFDIESLGDQTDLEAGYHYHALMESDEKYSPSNRPLVELPYTGQDLKNPVETRADYFQHMAQGTPYEVHFGAGFLKKSSRQTRTVSTAGQYDETMNARVSYWESTNTYPEWLVLEYGSAAIPPQSYPTHFRALTEQRVSEAVQTLYEDMADSLADAWEGNRLNSAGQLIDKYGRFAKYLPK